MKISVVIPVLNERESLPATLAEVESAGPVHEIICVDGGSQDGTLEWLRSRQCVRTLSSGRGKGTQLNVGALAATGEVLLFLHADAQLPPQALHEIRDVLRDDAVAGGCFCVRFSGSERSSLSLAVIAKGINLRTRVTKTGTGDQAIFIRRSVFEALGGCKEWPLFEDVDLVGRMKRIGAFRVLTSQVAISPRRYLQVGPWRTTLLIYLLRIGYWVGISPFKLKGWFDDIRPPMQQQSASGPSRSIGTRELPPAQSCAHEGCRGSARTPGP
jgi:rSAM/selenodomain-associated transferase 2